jgi:hypothetical protein
MPSIAGLVTELVEPPTEDATRASGPDDTWRSKFAIGMLVLALVPIVVSVIRAIVNGWVPMLDAGYFTVRSRDVLTAHHPWLGAWSSASLRLDTNIRNLGPLQLDLLAPFTKVNPYGGTAVGVGVVAAASVAAVWWSARRMLGPVGAGAAMLATVALEATVGLQAFIDPRQQFYLLMPYWALLWLTWAVAGGQGAAIAPLVFTASLIAQTHFTYLLQALLLVAAGLALYVATVRTRWREARATRSLLIGLGVGLACWAQPLWDQLLGDRNLGAVLSNRGANDGAGWVRSAEVISATTLRPPRLWLPGTIAGFDLPSDLPSQLWAWIAVAVWFALLVASAVLAWRQGLRALAVLPVVGTVSLVAALVAGASIPPSVFGLIAQNYLWMWPTGVFLTVGVVAGVVAAFPALRQSLEGTGGAIGITVVGVAFVIAVPRNVDDFAPIESVRSAGERVGRPLVDRFAAGLRRYGVSGPVVVDNASRAAFGSYVPYTFLAELQAAGIEFTFAPGDGNLLRFGRARCERGEASARIVLADGSGDRRPHDGEVVLAHVDGFTDSDAAELAELDRRFGDGLRDGSIDLDLAEFERRAGREVPELRAVLSTPGLSATGLASMIAVASELGVLEMPQELGDDVDDWVDLQIRSTAEDVTILLSPIPVADALGDGPVRARSCLS